MNCPNCGEKLKKAKGEKKIDEKLLKEILTEFAVQIDFIDAGLPKKWLDDIVYGKIVNL